MDQSNGLVISPEKLKENVWCHGYEISCFKFFSVASKPNIMLINTYQTETLTENVSEALLVRFVG